MKFPDDSPVITIKRDELKARVARFGIELSRVSESAIKSSGPGGQKVNKTSSGVRLCYDLGGELIVVKWTRERQHALNRFLALRELVDEIEFRISPQTSQRIKEIKQIRKQKSRRRRRRAN